MPPAFGLSTEIPYEHLEEPIHSTRKSCLRLVILFTVLICCFIAFMFAMTAYGSEIEAFYERNRLLSYVYPQAREIDVDTHFASYRDDYFAHTYWTSDAVDQVRRFYQHRASCAGCSQHTADGVFSIAGFDIQIADTIGRLEFPPGNPTPALSGGTYIQYVYRLNTRR